MNPHNAVDDYNNQAYEDVLDVLPPRFPNNEEYMKCYQAWRNVAGESHFDPHYSPGNEDFIDLLDCINAPACINEGTHHCKECVDESDFYPM